MRKHLQVDTSNGVRNIRLRTQREPPRNSDAELCAGRLWEPVELLAALGPPSTLDGCGTIGAKSSQALANAR
jgi:hypothetical protein